MKIRWTRESVRFRITPNELALVEAGHSVAERLHLPSNNGLWQAILTSSAAETGITMDGPDLIVSLSLDDRERLGRPDTEGVYFRSGADKGIRYFVEKDFPCVHPRVTDADESSCETFAPPTDFAARPRVPD